MTIWTAAANQQIDRANLHAAERGGRSYCQCAPRLTLAEQEAAAMERLARRLAHVEQPRFAPAKRSAAYADTLAQQDL